MTQYTTSKNAHLMPKLKLKFFDSIREKKTTPQGLTGVSGDLSACSREGGHKTD